MKKGLIIACVSFAMLAMAFTSCKNPGEKHKGYQQTKNGIYIKFLTQNEGETPKEGDVADLVFAYYVQDTNGRDSLLFSSQDRLKGQPFYDKIQKPLFVGDYYEAICMMHKGDSISMYLNVDSVFTKMFGLDSSNIPEFINRDADIRWEVKLNDFCSEEEFFSRKVSAAENEFKTYMSENAITAEPTESGLVYSCTQPGDGIHPQAGNNVKVNYTGMLFSGKKFDSSYDRNEPISFVLGQGNVIPGWDEGIALMSKGEKGVLYIPYNLGYGTFSPSPEIPAYSNLIFEVELVDFE